MAALVLDHLAQELVEHRVIAAADQGVVAGQRRQLVHGSPHHVDGGEVAGDDRAEHRRHEPQPVADTGPDPQLAPAARAGGHRGRAVGELRLGRDLDPVGAQEVGERLPVPQLLVHPAAQKGGDLRIGGHAGGEQVAQVDHRVRLDVHHVVEAHHVAVGEGVVRDLAPSRSRSGRPSSSCAGSGRGRIRPSSARSSGSLL